jgi:hypothetical protein
MSQIPLPRIENPMSPAEIAAENARIAKLLEGSDTPRSRKPGKAEIVAGLMNRIKAFPSTPGPDTPPVVEEVKPECAICSGRGRIKYAVPVGDARFGKTFPCPNPDCEGIKHAQEKRFVGMQEQVMRQFGLSPEWYDYASMTHFDEEDTRLAIRCARMWLNDGLIAGKDTVKKSMAFYGKAGTGKTYLISAMRNELAKRGIFAPFLKVRSMLKGVQRGYSEDAELRDYEAENILRNCPVLFIDELEMSVHSGDRLDIFESVIDYRCLHDLPTIIATNLAQDELADAWNHRIQSRLVHMAWWVALDDKTRRDVSPGMKFD